MKKILSLVLATFLALASLTACQNNSVVITNPNATYDCCNIINDNLVCNNIQTTIPIIQTTNPIIKTNNPMIQTNIRDVARRLHEHAAFA